MGIIRLLLALFVLLSHTYTIFGYQHMTGKLAVKSFFVISGFYMALILKEKYIGKDGSYWLYLSNRLVRIYPAYWLVLVVTIITSYILLDSGHLGAFGTYAKTHVLYANPIDILQDVTILVRNDYLQLNDNLHQQLLLGQAWTLVVELLFYSIAPFIVKDLRRIIVFICISLISRYFTFHFALTHHMSISDRFFLSELCFFLFGALAYYLYHALAQRHISKTVVRFITIAFIAFSLGYAYFPLNIQIRWMNLNDSFYVAALIIALPFIFLFSKINKTDRLVGELSYPVYLLHITVIMVIAAIGWQQSEKSYESIFIIFLTLGLAFIIVYYFERPFEDWRQQRLHQKNKLTQNIINSPGESWSPDKPKKLQEFR